MKTAIPVVILNWNGFDDTCACVQSLLHSEGCDRMNILVVDNGSTNDYGRLVDTFSDCNLVTIIGLDSNLGFASGINHVAENYLDLSATKHFILLNNDTVVEPDWFEKLVSYRNQADLVSSCMIHFFDRGKMDNAGHLFLNTGEILPRGSGELVESHRTPQKTVGVCLTGTP